MQFVLDRVLHDFANAVGGIISLTEHHLEHDPLEPGLQTSLGLIRDSAEQCRTMLAAVNGVAHPSGDDQTYVRADDLAESMSKLLRLFLPRTVQVAPLSASGSQAVVRVSPPEFHRRWLSVAAIECDGSGGTSQVSFSSRIDGDLCWFSYRSSNPQWEESAPEASRMLMPLAGSPERLRCRSSEQGFMAEIALLLEFEA